MREIKRGDIYLADLGDNIGSVQRGERPVIVVQNDKGNRFSPTITVIPTTTKIHRSKGFPTHVILDHMGGLDEESASMAEQITTISRDKLLRYIGSLTEKFMANKIDRTISIQLGLRTENAACATKASMKQKAETPDVPIWHKASLTIEEAAAYSNIGLNRIRELCKIPGNDFALQIGRKILVRREAFDEYLRSVKAL